MLFYICVISWPTTETYWAYGTQVYKMLALMYVSWIWLLKNPSIHVFEWWLNRQFPPYAATNCLHNLGLQPVFVRCPSCGVYFSSCFWILADWPFIFPLGVHHIVVLMVMGSFFLGANISYWFQVSFSKKNSLIIIIINNSKWTLKFLYLTSGFFTQH